MIICVCKRVSDRTIQELIECGVQYQEIIKITEATTCCGICTSDFDAYYMDHMNDDTRRIPSPG